MSTLLITVFVASLLGSLHCAGMCGPFLAFVMGGAGEDGGSDGRSAPHITVEGWRLTHCWVSSLGDWARCLILAGQWLGYQARPRSSPGH